MSKAALQIGGDVMATKALRESQPTLNDAPKFIRDRKRTAKNGECVVDISDAKARAAILDLIQPSIDKQMEHSRRLQAQIPKIEAVTPRGERREVAAHLEAGLGAKGFRPAVTRRKLGRLLSLERWSDGLLYRGTPDGGHECLNVCCMGTPLSPCSSKKCERCR